MSEAVKTKKSGNLLKIIIIVLLALILVGGASFAGYYFASKDRSTTKAQETQKPIKEAYFLAVNAKLVNLADSDSRRYVKATITIAHDSKNKKLAKELEQKIDTVEDAVISTLRNKKAADFEGKGAEDLKKEILARVNSLLEAGKATNVYYKDLLIQ